MANTKNTNDQNNTGRGFTGMDTDKKKEIAAKGGHSSQNGSQNSNNNNERTGKQGFASMDPDKQREIAAKGGHNSHKNG